MNISLLSLMHKGEFDAAELLLSSHFAAIDFAERDNMGNTPLIYAALFGQAGIAARVLESPQTDVNAYNEQGVTALLAAVQFGDYKTVKAVLDSDKINVDKRGSDSFGRVVETAQEYAERVGYTPFCHMIKMRRMELLKKKQA